MQHTKFSSISRPANESRASITPAPLRMAIFLLGAILGANVQVAAAALQSKGAEEAAPADIIGRVVAVSADGKQITLRLAPRKEDLTPLAEIKIGPETKLQYGRLPKEMQK